VGGRSAAGASSTSPNPTTAFLPDGENLLLRLPPTYFPLPPISFCRPFISSASTCIVHLLPPYFPPSPRQTQPSWVSFHWHVSIISAASDVGQFVIREIRETLVFHAILASVRSIRSWPPSLDTTCLWMFVLSVISIFLFFSFYFRKQV
jgi:hypothetical protein